MDRAISKNEVRAIDAANRHLPSNYEPNMHDMNYMREIATKQDAINNICIRGIDNNGNLVEIR